MSLTNLGDLSQSFSMRQRNIALRQDIDRFTTELATGQVADVRKVLDGNYSFLTDIERRTAILDGYGVATTEAALFTDATQQALSVIETFGSDLSASLLVAANSAVGVSGAEIVPEGYNALAGVLGSLNTNIADRHIFSGTATDRPPLPDTDSVLAALLPVISGAATPDDVLTAATAWFDDPAGFEATLYQGSPDSVGPVSLSQTDNVTMDVRAVDPRLKEVIKLTAIVALTDDPALGFARPEQSELLAKAGQSLLAAQDGIVSLRANVGFVESRIEGIATRNAAELTSLEFAKSGLLEIDPFEAATRLEETQFQLQSLYSVTVRMSQLSLVNFL